MIGCYQQQRKSQYQCELVKCFEASHQASSGLRQNSEEVHDTREIFAKQNHEFHGIQDTL